MKRYTIAVDVTVTESCTINVVVSADSEEEAYTKANSWEWDEELDEYNHVTLSREIDSADIDTLRERE